MVDQSVKDMKSMMQKSCESVQSTADSLTLLPKTMQSQAQRSIISAAKTAVNGISKAIRVSIEILKWIVKFVIERYEKLLICLVDTLSKTAVSAAAAQAIMIMQAVQTQTNVIRKGLKYDIEQLNKALDVMEQGLNTVPENIGSVVLDALNIPKNDQNVVNIDIPHVPVDWTDKITFDIPMNVVDTLRNASNQVPSLDKMKSQFADLVTTPLGMLQTLVKDSMDKVSGKVDQFSFRPLGMSNIPICNVKTLNVTWLDQLSAAYSSNLSLVIILAIVFLLVAIFLSIAVTHRRFQFKSKRFAYLEAVMFGSKTLIQDPLVHEDCARQIHVQDSILATESPIRYRVTRTIMDRFNPMTRRKWLWFFDYVSHAPSLLCLWLGLVMILSVETTMIVLHQTKDMVKPQQLVNGTQNVFRWVNESWSPHFQQWNQDIQELELTVQNEFDQFTDHTVGKVVDVGQQVEKVVKETLNQVFAPVPLLKTALTQFVQCALGSTIDNIAEFGQTLKNALSMTLPRVKLQDVIHEQDLNQFEDRIKSQIDQENYFEDWSHRMEHQLDSHRTTGIVFLVMGCMVWLMSIIQMVLWHFKEKKQPDDPVMTGIKRTESDTLIIANAERIQSFRASVIFP
jgi:hypothetical protein